MAEKESYDKSKDIAYYECAPIPLGEKAALYVSVNSYDGGPLKVVMLKGGEKWRSPSLGRMDMEHAEPFALAVAEAAAYIKSVAEQAAEVRTAEVKKAIAPIKRDKPGLDKTAPAKPVAKKPPLQPRK